MALPINKQCPERDAGLTHERRGESWECIHCWFLVYDPTDKDAILRAKFLEALRVTDPDGTKASDFAALTSTEWHLVVIERGRYESGTLTEWPDTIDSPEARHIAGQMADALLRLFRRVE